MNPLLTRLFVVCSLLFVLLRPTVAQCATDWLPGDPFPGVAGEVFASVMHDPDGAGPLGPRLVVGGMIHSAGSVRTKGLAVWDPATQQWSALGSGLDGQVHALVVLPNNDLVAAGHLSIPNGPPVGIARWNGATWSSMGVSTDWVNALALLPNGDLIAAGTSSFVDEITGQYLGSNLMKWDGASWTSMGTVGGIVSAAVMANGDLVVAGAWLGPQGDLLRWNGTAWSTFAPSLLSVSALTPLANGDLLAAGNTSGSGPLGVHRWDGVSWQPLGQGSNNWIHTLVVMPNGDVIAGGHFTQIGGVAVSGIARWSGTTWSALGTDPIGEVRTVTELPSGALAVGGAWAFGTLPLATSTGVWNGTTWSLLGSGTLGTVTAAVELANGDLVAAGEFSWIGGVAANRIARWNGTTWAPLGSGIDGEVRDMVELPNGDVVVCGQFSSASGVAVNSLARWDGATWSTLGWAPPSGFFNGSLNALAVMPNGDLVIGGAFATPSGVGAPRFVARWDGATWSPVGLGPNGPVRDMVVMPNGDLVIGGAFTAVNQPWFGVGGMPAHWIARWDGTTWSSLGTGMNHEVSALVVAANGDLVATGPFQFAGGVLANGIARWNGTAWSGLGAVAGAPSARLAAVLPDGDLVRWAPTNFPDQLERWDGTTWSPMATVDDPTCLLMRRNGELLVGGSHVIGTTFTSGYARLATNCPASSTGAGAGCPSSGGANTLTATRLPWVDGTFVATATGLPTTALVLAVTGFAPLPAVPLAGLVPNGQPGCDLYVTPTMLSLATATAGTAQASLFVPPLPSLVGLPFFHQMVVLETDPQGVVASTSTNALQLTVGVF